MQRRKRGLDVKTFFSWFSDNTDPAADDIAEVCVVYHAEYYMEYIYLQILQFYFIANTRLSRMIYGLTLCSTILHQTVKMVKTRTGKLNFKSRYFKIKHL